MLVNGYWVLYLKDTNVGPIDFDKMCGYVEGKDTNYPGCMVFRTTWRGDILMIIPYDNVLFIKPVQDEEE